MAKILHVDDSGYWRNTIAEDLREAGHEVVSFPNLPEAKLAFQMSKFDLVVCDGTLFTFGDGTAWAEELHAQGQKTVLVCLSPKTRIPFVDKHDYDVKPILRMLR